MGKIGANKLLTKALKSCPKSNKSPNLVTPCFKKKNIAEKSSRIAGVKKGLKI